MKPYTGKKLKPPYEKGSQKPSLEAYLPNQALIDAVNLAIFLERPLLIMGDPGCGKTRLAEAVAYDLYEEKYEDYYGRWDVKSTSKAKEGLYRYKALEKLRDAQTNSIKEEKKYIQEGVLWEAFEKSTKENRTILLIDEIDKADMDFPNDLLLELEKNEFKIMETGETKSADCPPIVFITCNSEDSSKLSPAFLRRCLYHHITFPKKEELKDILSSHFEDGNADLVEQVVTEFLKVRQNQEEIDADKKVSTSELIDWFKIIHYCSQLDKKTANDYEKSLITQYEKLGKETIPFKQVLLKNWNNHISQF